MAQNPKSDEGCMVMTLGCVTLLGFVAAVSLGSAWIIMLLLGTLASQTGWNCALGFWPVWIVMFLVGIIGSRFRTWTTK